MAVGGGGFVCVAWNVLVRVQSGLTVRTIININDCERNGISHACGPFVCTI